MQPITSFLLGLAEHTPETKEEDDYGEDQFGNQTGVVLDFGHAFDVTCAAANRERAHEKAKEQEQTLANYHPSDGFWFGVEMESALFNSRLVFKHEDDEGGRDVERSKIHSRAVGVQKVSLSQVFGGWTWELVLWGSETVAEGIANGAEDQAIDQEHLYPKPLLKGGLFFGHASSVDSG